MENFLGRVSRSVIIALAFLLPLTVLPITVNQLEVNKQTLLVIVVFVALLAYLGQMVSKKEVTLRRGALQTLPVLFFFGVLLSSIAAHGGFLSFIGQDSQEYVSVLTTCAFLGLFFLIVQESGSGNRQKQIISALLSSAMLIATQLALQVCGISFLNFLGGSIASNTIGTINAAMIFLIVCTVVSNGLWLLPEQEKPFNKVRTLLLSLSTLILLIALDYWVLWAVLLVGLGTLFALAMVRAEEFTKTNRFTLPMSLLVVALLLLFLPTPLHLALPAEVTPSQNTSWQIASDSLKDSSYVFGTGPGSYVNDYTKFRPAATNASQFWSVRFDRGASYILTLLPTIGIVGITGFLLFLLALAGRTFVLLVNEREHTEWKNLFVLASAWLALTVSLFLYSSNLTNLFLFWVLSALLTRHLHNKTKTLSFTNSPRAGLASSFLFVLVAVGIVTGLFVTSQRYAAEIAFAQGVALDAQGGDLNQIITKLNAAATYNRLSDVYYRNLSQALLIKVKREFANNLSQDQAQTLLQITALSINAAKRATELNPNNMANWSVLGSLYREVSSIDPNAGAFAISAFTQAHVLDPQNPVHFDDLGKMYLMNVQNANNKATKEQTTADPTFVSDNLTKAEEALNNAIAVKPDYGPAHYDLAAVYELQGRLVDAISKMEVIRKYNSRDVGMAFQLGLLYLRQGKNDLAEAELLRAIGLEPNFANAHWFLGAIYEQQGNIDKAIVEVAAVLAVNPNNELVQAKLDRLKAGQISTVIPEPVEAGNETATTVENGQPQQ